MNTIHEEHAKMVKDLMKKGSIMKSEWTNDEKEKLRAISRLGDAANKLHSKVEKLFFPMGNDSDYELYHMTYAFCGEVGELSDAFKKSIVYRKELNAVNVLEECGDLSFYSQGIIILFNANLQRYAVLNKYIGELLSQLMGCFSIIGITIEQAKEQNMHKLLKGDTARYKEGKYTDEQAKKRADKNEFIRLEFVLNSDVTDVETLCVDFYPDVPEVRISGQALRLATYTSKSNHVFDHELLVQMCKSKIEKEGL